MEDDSAEKKWQKTQGYVLPGFSRFQEAYRNSTRRAPLSGGFRRSTPGRHASTRSTGKSFYHVKTPRRMLVYVAAIFFILPISIFILKELHMHTTEEHHNEQVLQKEHQAAHRGKNAFVTWMEEAEKEASHEHIFEPIVPEHDNTNTSLSHLIGDFLGLNHDDEDEHKPLLRQAIHNQTAQNHPPHRQSNLEPLSEEQKEIDENRQSPSLGGQHDSRVADFPEVEKMSNVDEPHDSIDKAVVAEREFDDGPQKPEEDPQNENGQNGGSHQPVGFAANLVQNPEEITSDGNEDDEETENDEDDAQEGINSGDGVSSGPESKKSQNENAEDEAAAPVEGEQKQENDIISGPDSVREGEAPEEENEADVDAGRKRRTPGRTATASVTWNISMMYRKRSTSAQDQFFIGT